MTDDKHKNKGKVLKWVVITHTALVLLVALPVSFSSCNDNEIEAIPVRVISQVPAPARDTSSDTAITPKPDEREAAIPPQPDNQQQKPPPESVPKQPPPKPENRLRTADEIRRDARLEPISGQPRRNTTPQVDASELQRRLQDKLERQSDENNALTTTDQSPQTESAELITRYANEVVRVILYRRWQTPTASEMGNSSPKTDVKLVISADGTVKQARIIRASGNSAMDASVRQLLTNLKRLPPLRSRGIRNRQITITISFDPE
ncbi:MAG: TonB family protein [Lentisphaeria bacterium]